MEIVYIKWMDACELEQYHKDATLPKGKEGLGLQTTYSVGIVLEDAKEYISLAQNLSDNGWYRGIINIPKVCIIKNVAMG